MAHGQYSEFTSYPLNDKGLKKSEELTEAFSQLMDKLNELCPNDVRLATAKTRLEEASFWARKSMASAPENRRPT